MLRIKRWMNGKRRVVWTEPKLPPFVKINPNGVTPGPDDTIQPGDITMGAIAEEFLSTGEGEAPALL
jgi:hypothetical protein